MHSIKTKLIAAISIFIIFLFTITAYLFIDEKKKELGRDIYLKARSFSELSTARVVDLYERLYARQSFVLFNTEMRAVFENNEDIVGIKVYSFSGDLLYDSTTEGDRSYEGPVRQTTDTDIRGRIKAHIPSYLLSNGRIVYLKNDLQGDYMAVNENEREVGDISSDEEIRTIVYPVASKYAVEFLLTYDKLNQRVARTTERGIYLLVFGVLLGLGFGWYFSRRITDPIEKLTEGALVLSKGDFTKRVTVKSRDEVGILADTFNKMAESLEASTQALIYEERVQKELEVAAKIQRQTVPRYIPRIHGLDVAATLMPAVEIGGDCYDFIEIDPENHLFYVSDVAGHGVPAGIVVSIANALIYSYSKLLSLSDIISHTNAVLKEKTTDNMFMTLLMLRFAKGRLAYVSAGHPEMLHYHASEKKVTAEKGGGLALGIVPDIAHMVKEVEVDFQLGDCVVLYSDGVNEAVSPKGEQYGIARLKRALSEYGGLATAEAIQKALIADVKAFMADAKQNDDITMVVAKRM